MSVITALARIDEIQQRVMSLAAQPAVPPGSAATALVGSTAGAGAFASAVEQIRSSMALPEGGATGEDVVAQAKKYLGVPYVFGGEDMSGMDCSGLVQRVLADLGIDAPRVVQDQADIGVEVGSLAEARPGDLLVTNGEKHIVIYAGDGKIIHAPSPGKNVELRNNYLTDADIQTIRRVVPPAQPAPAAASAHVAQVLSAAPSVTQTVAGPSVTQMFAAAPAVTQMFAAAPSVTQTLAAAPFGVSAAPASAPGALRTAPTPAAPVAEAGRTDASSASPVASAAAAGLAGSGTTEQVAAPPPPAPVAPAARTPLAQQVTAPVLSLARAGDGQHTLTLRVSPENLGPVTVTAQISGSAMTIELATASDVGREALRALLVDLRRDLAVLAPNASILLSSGDASTNNGGQSPGPGAWTGGAGSSSTSSGSSGSADPQGRQTPADGSGDRAADAPAPVPTAPPVPGSGIDLFA